MKLFKVETNSQKLYKGNMETEKCAGLKVKLYYFIYGYSKSVCIKMKI